MSFAALCTLTATADAARVKTLKPVHVSRHALVFRVAGMQPKAIVGARAKLRPNRKRLHRLLAHRYAGHPAARRRARRRIRHRIHRRLEVWHVRHAAATGGHLRMAKPKWARNGELELSTLAGAGSGDTVPDAGPPGGRLVQADNLTQACPIDHLWGAVSDAYYYTQSCSSWSDADDPQVNYSASGGPSFALPGNQVRPGFRRLSLTAGMQSLYDAGVPNSSYRAQLVSNSNTRTYYPMQPGHRYVWWITVRFQDPTQLPGDKVTQDSQIAQIKNTGTCTTSSTEGPIESLSETQNNVLLKERQADGDVRIDSFPIVQRGVWQVFALDVMYTNDRSQAAYQLWADQDGDSTLNMTPLTPKITGRVTAVGPDCVGKPSIGPYEPMSLPPVSRDYGVNQMVEVPVGAPWG